MDKFTPDAGVVSSREDTKPVRYSLECLILMFFIFSFVGWIWEVIYIGFTEGVIAKRGMLHGPWLPIYGVGGVLILILLGRFRAKPAVVFFLALLLCGTMEYSTGVAVEHIFKCRWWDYSNKFMNIEGRICLEGLLLFGISSMAAVCKFGPMLRDAIGKLGCDLHRLLCIVLSAAFVIDLIFSMIMPNVGKGVTYELLTDVGFSFVELDFVGWK